IIDPVHYSAGSSAYDMFSFGLPVVTMPGEHFVSRYTTACYRRMQMTGLVAATAAEYVSLAIQIANDRETRMKVSAELTDRRTVLSQDEEGVYEHERFFEYAAAVRM